MQVLILCLGGGVVVWFFWFCFLISCTVENLAPRKSVQLAQRLWLVSRYTARIHSQ